MNSRRLICASPDHYSIRVWVRPARTLCVRRAPERSVYRGRRLAPVLNGPRFRPWGKGEPDEYECFLQALAHVHMALIRKPLSKDGPLAGGIIVEETTDMDRSLTGAFRTVARRRRYECSGGAHGRSGEDVVHFARAPCY